MTLNINKNESTMTVAITGRLDTTTAPELENALKENLPGVTELTVDCGALEYISSAGLRVILGAQKTMNKQGRMTVCKVNEAVQEVFDITGFADILTIV